MKNVLKKRSFFALTFAVLIVAISSCSKKASDNVQPDVKSQLIATWVTPAAGYFFTSPDNKTWTGADASYKQSKLALRSDGTGDDLQLFNGLYVGTSNGTWSYNSATNILKTPSGIYDYTVVHVDAGGLTLSFAATGKSYAYGQIIFIKQ